MGPEKKEKKRWTPGSLWVDSRGENEAWQLQIDEHQQLGSVQVLHKHIFTDSFSAIQTNVLTPSSKMFVFFCGGETGIESLFFFHFLDLIFYFYCVLGFSCLSHVACALHFCSEEEYVCIAAVPGTQFPRTKTIG